MEYERDSSHQVVEGVFCYHVRDDGELDIVFKWNRQCALNILYLRGFSNNSADSVASLQSCQESFEANKAAHSSNMKALVSKRMRNW